MITRPARHAERILARLDPAADLSQEPEPGSRPEALRLILATPVDEKPLRANPVPRARRRLVLAGAMAALVAGATAIAIGVVRPSPPPVYAATPAALVYLRSPGTTAGVLAAIADAARRSPTKGSGGYGYLHTRQWSLDNPNLVRDKNAYLGVHPSDMRLWYRTDDGSVRYLQRSYNPDTGTDDTSDSTAPAGTHKNYVCWSTSVVPRTCPVDKLTDPAVLGRVLMITGGGALVDGTGIESPLGATAQLFRDNVLPPSVRSEVWRVVAELPGLTYSGRVTDRAGRSGEAFSLEFDAKTGPVRDTVIVDPATGQLLGYERTLLRLTDPHYFDRLAPGSVPLKIRTPSVVEYTVYLAEELRTTNK